MKHSFASALLSVVFFSSCASHQNACEDVTVAKEQIQACQALQRQIVKAKDRPLIRTELERRYQTDCVEMRYYRDEHQQAICGNKEKIKAMNKAVINEQ